MNILIKNENNKQVSMLNVDVIKTFTGVFTKAQIENELLNFYYNKAIIDITAISNFFDTSSLLEFLSVFDSSKVIILLNESELVNSKDYLSYLVKNGYYNFTRSASNISYLIDHANSYENVKQYVDVELDSNPTQPNMFMNSSQKSETKSEYTPDTKKEPFHKNYKLIGIQNLTEHAGATTLMYLLVHHLNMNYRAKGIEMFSQDSIYFHDDSLSICLSENDLVGKLSIFQEVDVVFIDLNGYENPDMCDDILYLVEPGLIPLNKLIKKGIQNIDKINSRKVIINRSSLMDENIPNFAYETKLKIFYNLKNLNERRERILDIDLLLLKLGFNKQKIK